MADRTQRLVNLTGVSAGKVRVAAFDGRDFLVVPIVALIGDQVVWPANADTPEFVPASELAPAAKSWTGRPAVGDHPKSGNVYISAAAPHVQEKHSFGMIGSSWIDKDNRLLMDVWLDRARAEVVGEDALDVVARAAAQEPIEVSVGAMVEMEEASGVTADGKRYNGVWRNIVGDHIALLPRGVRGACSNEMGCGLRAAKMHLVTAEGLTLAPETEPVPAQGQLHTPTGSQGQLVGSDATQEEPMEKKLTAMQRLKRLFGAEDSPLEVVRLRGASEYDGMGPTDYDLREKISQALFASEPAFAGLDAVYPEEKKVIYACMPDTVHIYRRSYEVDLSGAIKLGTDTEEVEPVTVYKPVTAAQANPAEELGQVINELVALAGRRHSQSDLNMIQTVHDHSVSLGAQCAQATAEPAALSQHGDNNDSVNDAAAKEPDMKTLEQRVKALIENPKSPFSPCDAKALEGLTESTLAVLEAQAGDPTPKAPEVPKNPDQPTPEPPKPELPPGVVAVPEAELAFLRGLQAKEQAREQARKDELVRALSGKVNGAYTDDELKALGVDQLEKLAVLAKAAAQPTMVGKVLGSVSGGQHAAPPPPPDPVAVARAVSEGRDPFAAAS